MAFPAGRAVRSYCLGISHGSVSAAIPNANLKQLFKLVHLSMAFEMHLYIGTARATDKSNSVYPIGEKHAILLFIKEDVNSEYDSIKAEEIVVSTGWDNIEFTRCGKVSEDKIAGNSNEDSYYDAVESGSSLIIYGDPITN